MTKSVLVAIGHILSKKCYGPSYSGHACGVAHLTIPVMLQMYRMYPVLPAFSLNSMWDNLFISFVTQVYTSSL